MKSPAVCSWSLRPESPEALADAVRRCGLDAVQLALVPCVEDPAWADGVARLRALGIRIVSGMLATVGEDYSTLASIAGKRLPPPREVLVTEEPDAPVPLWRFRLARLDADGRARLLPVRSSGDVAIAGRSDGFLEIAPGDRIEAGRRYPLFAWDG